MKIASLTLTMLLVAAPAVAGPTAKNSSTWYIASGTTGQCIAVPADVVAATRGEWKAKGAPISDRVLDGGGHSLTIFQGGDKMLLLYEKESDCRMWLPVAIQMAQEQHD